MPTPSFRAKGGPKGPNDDSDSDDGPVRGRTQEKECEKRYDDNDYDDDDSEARVRAHLMTPSLEDAPGSGLDLSLSTKPRRRLIRQK